MIIYYYTCEKCNTNIITNECRKQCKCGGNLKIIPESKVKGEIEKWTI